MTCIKQKTRLKSIVPSLEPAVSQVNTLQMPEGLRRVRQGFFCHLPTSFHGFMTSLGLKIERQAGLTFVPSVMLYAQKENIPVLAKLSRANEGRSLTLLHAGNHGNSSLNTSSPFRKVGWFFLTLVWDMLRRSCGLPIV